MSDLPGVHPWVVLAFAKLRNRAKAIAHRRAFPTVVTVIRGVPDRMAGQNIGPESSARETGGRTAYDDKDLHRALRELPDQMLKQISIVPEGTRLEQGATYLDLREESPQAFTAQGQETATAEHRYVAKDHVPYHIWNHLIGEEKPGQHL